jgi:ribosomal protein S18 acetylase RimI-like enzyme
MATAEITLEPMTEEAFAAWLEPTVRRFAQAHIDSGDWPEQDALQFAATEFRMLLPDGLQTDQQHLFTVREGVGGVGGEGAGAGVGDAAAVAGAAVGMLWIGVKMRGGKLDAFVYNVEIDEPYRGRGYGRATMVAGAQRGRELGAQTISLHVFGANTTARALYTSLGFVETEVNMTLPLDGGGSDGTGEN